MQRASTHNCKLSCDQTPELHPRQGPPLAQSSSLLPDAQLTAGPEQPGSSSSSSSGAQRSRVRDKDRAVAQRGLCLFAFPLESNFSGERYAPSLINQIRKQGLSVTDHTEQKEEEAQRQEESQGPGQPQSDIQTLSMANQQHDYRQQRGEAEVQQAVQGLRRKEEHWQHQPAAEEPAEGLSGQQSCKEEARGAPSRPSHSEGARWHVLIDAAKACATAPPDLTKHPADFVVNTQSLFVFPTANHSITRL